MSSKPAVLLFLFIATVASLTAAFPSNCLNFEQGDYVEGTGLPTTAYSGITIEAWVRHSDLTGTAQRYITVKPELAVLRMNGGSLHFYVKQSDGTLEGLTADVLATDEWLHVAGTYDGANLKLYLNGVLVAGDTATVGGFYTPTGEFDISANGESMHGCIDEVRLWTWCAPRRRFRPIALPMCPPPAPAWWPTGSWTPAPAPRPRTPWAPPTARCTT
jgi:hypothetical protein